MKVLMMSILTIPVPESLMSSSSVEVKHVLILNKSTLNLVLYIGGSAVINAQQ